MKKLGILVALVVAAGVIGIVGTNYTQAGGGWQASHPAVWNNLVIAPITMSAGETHRSAICGINIDNGIIEWKYEVPDRVFSSAAVEGDKVYIVVPHLKYPYRYLACLNAKTGELVKEVPFEKATYNRPLIRDGLIYIGTTGISQGRGTIECYDLDLNFKWMFEQISSNDMLDGWVYGVPGYEVIDGKPWLFVGSYNSKVMPVDAKTGKGKPLLWKNTSFQTNGSGPNDFWGEKNQIFQAGGPIENDIVVKDGKLWFGCMDGFAYCLNAKDGQRVWKFEDIRDPKDNTKDNAKIATNIRFARSSPLLIGDNMFMGSQAVMDKGNGMYLINASTGAVQGFFKTSDYVNGTPVQVGNNLVFGCDNGSIYCITQSLTEVWKTPVVGNPSCKPLLINDKLIFCVREPGGVFPQKVVCLNTSGQIQWKTEQFK